MEKGGCLWCVSEEDIEDFDFDQFLQDEIKNSPTPDSESNETVSSNSLDQPEQECCICYETINKNKNNCVTECGHVFCLKCLVTSFAHGNNACPCCRAEMIDMPDDGDVNVIEDDDDDDEYSESNESDNNDSDDDDDKDECGIEELVSRMEANSIGVKEILSMFLGRYTKDSTLLSINDLNRKFDDILDAADEETKEQNLFALEDVRF
jgi:hypothetical protein